MRCPRSTRRKRSARSGSIGETAGGATRACEFDHILLLKTLARHLTAAATDRAARGQDGPSDRAPVWVGLR